jgi:hypothetical protein
MPTFIPSLCYIMYMSTLITASWQKSGATETEEDGRKRDATFLLLVSLFITAKFPPFTVGRWNSVWKSQVTAALFHRILYTAPSKYFLSRSFHRPVYFTPCFSFLFFPVRNFPFKGKICRCIGTFPGHVVSYFILKELPNVVHWQLH